MAHQYNNINPQQQQPVNPSNNRQRQNCSSENIRYIPQTTNSKRSNITFQKQHYRPQEVSTTPKSQQSQDFSLNNHQYQKPQTILKSDSPSLGSSSSMSLVKPSVINKAGEKIQEMKQKQHRLKEEVQNIVEKETYQERKNLEDAMQNYNQKIKDIMKRKDIEQKRLEHEEYSLKLQELMDRISNAFKKAILHIRRDNNLTDEQKSKQIKGLEKQIVQAVLSEDERKILEALEQQITMLSNMSESNNNISFNPNTKLIMM